MLSKLRDLLKNSALYSFSALASGFIGIILVPIYTRFFLPDQYGIIDIISISTALLALFVVAGIDNGIARFFIDAESPNDRNLTASTGVFYLAAVSLAVTVILIPFSSLLSKLILGSSEYGLYLLVGLAVIPFTLLSSMFTSLLRCRFQAVRAALVSVGILLVQVVMTILLVVLLHIGILGVFIAILITNFIFSGIGFWLTRNNYSRVFSLKKLKQMFYFGLPYLMLALCYYIMSYSNRYFLTYYSGLDAVGLYGIGYRLASVISIITAGFQFAWGPFYYSTYRDDDAKRTFAKVFDYASTVICIGILFLSLFSRELLRIFTTESYLGAYKVVPLISGSLAVYTMGCYFAIGIGITKKTMHMAWTSIIAAICNILLNIALIPSLGIVGAALSTIISFAIMGILLMTISQKLYKVPYRFASNLIMYFITAFIIFIAYRFFFGEMSWTNIIIKASLIIGFLAAPFILNQVGRPEMKYIGSLVTGIRKRR